MGGDFARRGLRNHLALCIPALPPEPTTGIGNTHRFMLVVILGSDTAAVGKGLFCQVGVLVIPPAVGIARRVNLGDGPALLIVLITVNTAEWRNTGKWQPPLVIAQ
ncbi:Uncharacterised protein [Yersinia similis]|nr:Uncharacterised protein [Yersinia similis]CNF73464.1 Uncharacterised protein [Yersinia similis]